jgi:hypothetical protein
MSVEVITIAQGEQRQQVLNLPKRLTITVTREDGYAPSPVEIYTAMTIAMESMTPKKKPRTKSSLKL